MKVEAVLFDVDGTLLDTFEFIYQAFEKTFERHGLAVPDREVINRSMGGPLSECYACMTSDVDPHMLVESHRTFQVENLALVRRFPATLDVLDLLRERGIKLAAVTTRSIRSSVRSMETAGIAHYFNIILSAEDVQNHKPHPEQLHKALEALGCHASQSVMIGDTYADIEAGKAAGTVTVLAHYGFGAERALAAGPDYIIHDLAELPALLESL